MISGSGCDGHPNIVEMIRQYCAGGRMRHRCLWALPPRWEYTHLVLALILLLRLWSDLKAGSPRMGVRS